MKWVGDLDHFSELKEVWITLEGIPPRWCDCKVFAQMASSFGMLLDVDWSSLFKSYERVRVRVACRNPRKIPPERLFEMDKKLYLISIHVEGYEQEESDKTDIDDNDGMDDFGNDDHQEGVIMTQQARIRWRLRLQMNIEGMHQLDRGVHQGRREQRQWLLVWKQNQCVALLKRVWTKVSLGLRKWKF
jgi:hypothetical protein